MESGARLAPSGPAGLIRVRDGGTCRTPWCDAPVRHVDHVVAHSRGGATSEANSAGLCQACNLVEETSGWRSGTGPPGDRHTTTTTTPTGHSYDSEAPPLPGTRADGRSQSPPRVDLVVVTGHHVDPVGVIEEWTFRHMRAA